MTFHLCKHALLIVVALLAVVAPVAALCGNFNGSPSTTTCVPQDLCTNGKGKPMPFPPGGLESTDETVFVDNGNNVLFDIFLFSSNVATNVKKRGFDTGVQLTNASPVITTSCIACGCDDQTNLLAACELNAPLPDINCPGGYTIPITSDSGATHQFACLRFSGPPLSANADTAAIALSPTQLRVKITIASQTSINDFDTGAYATKNGLLIGLALRKGAEVGLLYLACGPFVQIGLLTGTKRQQTGSNEFSSLGPGLFSASAAADPHLIGADGVKYDFAGQAGGDYVLFSSPVFVVNMHLASAGPSMHFITRFGILYRGAKFVIGPFDTKAAHVEKLAAQFAKLGDDANVTGHGLRMWISFCDNHVISFSPAHTSGANWTNYFGFTVSVPGCHEDYDGALGFTYRCSHRANPTLWSSDQEEKYRLPSLTAASGRYLPDAACAHEAEFGDERLQGGMKADL